MANTPERVFRQIKPGEMVVSLNDFLDKLGNKITQEERDKLLIAMLIRRTDKVKAGDLITSNLLNQILADIENLDTRLADLENQQPVTTTDVEIDRIHPSENLTVGDEIAIEGRNFEFSLGATYVTFGKKSVFAFKAGSRDDRLIVDVPDLGHLQAEGEKVPLTVANRTSSDFRMVTVHPAEAPLYGNVLLVPGTVDPNPPQAAKDNYFPYTITSAASQETTFKIGVLLGGPNEQPDDTKYAHLVTILNKNRQPIQNKAVKLQPNTNAIFYVKVSQLPFTGDFSILVTATAPGVEGDSGVRHYAVGSEDPNDELLTLDSPTYSPDGVVSNGVVSLKINQNLKASVTLTLSDMAIAAGMTSAKCDFALDLTNGTGWTLLLLDPTPDTGSTTNAKNITVTKDVPRIVEFAIIAKPNPSQAGNMELTIIRQEQAARAKKKKTFGLALKVVS